MLKAASLLFDTARTARRPANILHFGRNDATWRATLQRETGKRPSVNWHRGSARRLLAARTETITGFAGKQIHPFNQSRETLMNQDMPDFSNVQSGSSSTATKIYEVVSGDSLSKIAKREYGDANKWERIYEANRDVLKNPDKIYPGQKLKIPPL